MKIRVGMGFDVHRLVEGRELWLGGIRIDHTLGLLGHSDADVVIHAFRDTVTLIRDKGYEIGNADITICAERPKLNPHIPAMQECLSRIMGVEVEDVSIKATTTEKLGFTGREEGISAYAVVLLEKQ